MCGHMARGGAKPCEIVAECGRESSSDVVRASKLLSSGGSRHTLRCTNYLEYLDLVFKAKFVKVCTCIV